ncbi:DUF559 domain-containing protein [Paenibacillus albidus]|uniref:DUF559 domain-containing protein n=1 Tax=Paenibacillus albidus TaxID=2041023 RepID=UPI001BEAE793|nr:DUF559 domain-containing protein [Paenibacillus albidus]MBT2290590.1 DUF559 domain-containing protein [Paenibacillus albidus]
MGYEQEYEAFIQRHISSRSGERRGRLERGHQHAEALFLLQVWWPLRGSFSGLHPEYEVLDWRGRSYFADFAFISGPLRLLIEIKGYAAHVKEMDRQKYCNELNRETFLTAMGYQVISFAYDDVERRPELCQTLLRMVLSRYMATAGPAAKRLLTEREVIRLMIRQGGRVRLQEVCEHCAMDPKTARLMMYSLCDKGWLVPVKGGNGVRIVRYELAQHVLDYWEE